VQSPPYQPHGVQIDLDERVSFRVFFLRASTTGFISMIIIARAPYRYYNNIILFHALFAITRLNMIINARAADDDVACGIYLYRTRSDMIDRIVMRSNFRAADEHVRFFRHRA
jgi:hypothetical protein